MSKKSPLFIHSLKKDFINPNGNTINQAAVEDLIKKLGDVLSNELVVRGTKHTSNILKEPEPMKEISSLWQKYIR